MLPTSPPPDFSPKAEVAGILTYIDDKILLLQRLPNHAQANLWCAPGGKIGVGEMPLEAVMRELKEETGIEVEANGVSYLGKYYVRYPNGDYLFHLFRTELQGVKEITICQKEHQSYGLYSFEELSELPLTPGLYETFVTFTNGNED